MFLGCSVLFAIWDAVSAARRERGLPGTLALSCPLTPEKIRMACEDRFTKMVGPLGEGWDDAQALALPQVFGLKSTLALSLEP